MNKIIVIVGPTAVGKTKVSIELAKKFNGEIIFTTRDYELNSTVANRIIEIKSDGTIIDRMISY